MIMLITRNLVSTLLILLIVYSNLEASESTVKNMQSFPVDASQHSLPSKLCATGSSTLLELGGLSRSTRHNGNDGEAHFVLKRKTNGYALWKDEFVGEGICFGFNAHMRKYVVGSRKEHGIGVRLTNVFYINEVTQMRQVSVFNKRKIEAFAAVPSPDLNYVVFIAIDHNEMGLFVLDVERNALRKLGEAPLPPPLTTKELEYARENPNSLDCQWGWMASFRDGYMELDSGIIVFVENDLLKVSYGNDTAYQRAKDRNIMSWNLNIMRRQP